MINGVKWGRRVGQKEKFLLDLDMRRSFVTLVKTVSETWWALGYYLCLWVIIYVFDGGICSQKTTSNI